jgi:hypothetical protein
MFTSASEAKIGGCTFSILQLASSNLFNSKIELYSDINKIYYTAILFIDLFFSERAGVATATRADGVGLVPTI